MTEISILIVEDEVMTALYMERMLTKNGYNVLKCVPSGEEGVEFAGRYKPDLVLMDIRLAGEIDGIETVKRIQYESGTEMQFIFTTGYSDVELKEQAIKLDPLGYLLKPVNLPELYMLIESFFKRE